MTKPDVVVFDLGKVLLEFDYGIAADKIAARGNMSALEVQRFIDHSPLLFRYETGLIGKEEFFRAIREATDYRGDLAEFSLCFADIFSSIDPMVELHAQLRERGVPTYIFSNTNDLAVAHIRRRFPFFSTFTDYVLSYEHGAMKPDHKLYEVVERLTRRAGSSILYLDDRLENAAAGEARQWQVIHHRSPEQTVQAVRQLKLLQ